MIELTPLLNKQLKTPLYIQLYEYIKKRNRGRRHPSGSSFAADPLFMRTFASKQKYS